MFCSPSSVHQHVCVAVPVLFALSFRASEVSKELSQPLRDSLMHLSFLLTSLSLCLSLALSHSPVCRRARAACSVPDICTHIKFLFHTTRKKHKEPPLTPAWCSSCPEMTVAEGGSICGKWPDFIVLCAQVLWAWFIFAEVAVVHEPGFSSGQDITGLHRVALMG